MTWNLWWQFGPWEERQPAIGAELERVDPDVALLQEVWSNEDEDQAEILAERLGFNLVRTTTADGAPQRFGNAIVSRWPIEWSKMVRLPAVDGSPSNRTVLAASIATPAGSQLFAVTHLAWQYDAGPLRVRQLQEVVSLVARLQPEDEHAPPAIVAGDFNAVPDSDEIRRLTGLATPYDSGLIFTDCWAAVGEGPGFTWSRDNPHSVDALWPRRRLDYVFVTWPRPKPLCNPLSARLAGTDARAGIVASDHYAVVVELDDRQTLDDE